MMAYILCLPCKPRFFGPGEPLGVGKFGECYTGSFDYLEEVEGRDREVVPCSLSRNKIPKVEYYSNFR